MKTSDPTGRRRMLAGASLLCVAGLPRLAPASTGGSFQIIVHPEVKVRDLSAADLKAMFILRKRQFADGTPATLVVLDDHDPRQRAFATHVLGVLPYALRQSWDGQSLSGSARPPVVVASPAEMVRKVASTRGAIGYLGSRDGVTPEGVKHVEIR